MDPFQRSRIGQVAVQGNDGQQRGALGFSGLHPDFFVNNPQLLQNPALLQHLLASNPQLLQPAFDPMSLTTLYDGHNPNANGQYVDFNAQDGHRFAFNQPQLQFQQPQLPQQPNPNAAAFRVASQPANINTHSPYFQPSPLQLPQQPVARPRIFSDNVKWKRTEFTNPQTIVSTLAIINNDKYQSEFELEDDSFQDGDNSALHKPKRARTEKESVKEPVKSRRPSDPVEALRYEGMKALTDDTVELADQVAKFNDIMSKAETVPMRKALVEVLENRRTEYIATIGKIRYLPLTFQRWLVNIYNTHKSAIAGKEASDVKVDSDTDQLVNSILKVLSMMDIKMSELEKFKLDKVANTLHKKWPSEGTKKMAQNLIEKAKKLERQATKKEKTEDEPKSESLKRKSEESDSNSTKRVASGSSTSSAPGTKPPSTATSQQTGTAATAKKPAATGGAFFKALQSVKSASAPSKPAPAAPAPTPAAAAPTTNSTFSSIFDQLKERQKKDEEVKTKRTETGKPEEPKKKKVKKTVTWKSEGELTQVKLFEVLEPEGEYYGGGTGQLHDWSDARGLDVAEGRDAKEALRNRNFVDEEEEDFLEWYTPIVIDTSLMFDGKDLTTEHQPLKRLGDRLPVAEDAKVQSAREANVLSVTYYNVRDIPFSPAEPENGGDTGPYDPKKPVLMKLSDEPAPENGLDNLLAQFQPQAAAPPPVENNPAAAILATLQGLNPAAQQPAPAAPAANPLGSLLASLVGAQAAATPAQPAPAVDFNALLQSLGAAQQPAQQAQPADGIAALLATIAGGAPPVPNAQQPPQMQHQNSWDEHDRGSSRWDQRSSGRDVRRELREKSGWSDDHERSNPPGQGGGWKKWDNNNKSKVKGKKKPLKTIPCQFYRDGRCRMGEDCRFAHIDD